MKLKAKIISLVKPISYVYSFEEQNVIDAALSSKSIPLPLHVDGTAVGFASCKLNFPDIFIEAKVTNPYVTDSIKDKVIHGMLSIVPRGVASFHSDGSVSNIIYQSFDLVLNEDPSIDSHCELVTEDEDEHE